MTLRDKYTQEINYLELGFIIVCSSILKSLWMIYIDNLAYRVVGLNRESAYHTFIVALIATVIFLSFVSIFNNANAGFTSDPSTPQNITPQNITSQNITPSQNITSQNITDEADFWYLEPLRIEALYKEPVRLF